MSGLAYTDDMATEQTDTHPHAPDEHYCEHTDCGEWGGYGMARSRGEPVRWWCWPHYPYKEPGSARTGGSLAERLSRPISSIGGGHGHSGT